jgi:DNA polymerase-3 subunit epsilon
MGKFDGQPFVCLDCETTGLDPKEDRIIEIAVISFTVDGHIEEFSSLINPERAIPAESTLIHHITDEMVASQPKIEEVLPQVLKLIGNRTIIGHGVSFDIELVALAAERRGIIHTLRKNRVLDTLRMARLYGKSPTNSLERLREHFMIEAEGAHRALSDVTVNISVFLNLLKDYRNLEHLLEILEKPILMPIMPLGKYKGRLIKDLPNEYLKWASHQSFDRDLLFSLRSEIKRRKNGALFERSGNPFTALNS